MNTGNTSMSKEVSSKNSEQSSVRVPLVVPGTRPELAAIEQNIMAERGRVSLLYQVLLNSPAIASGWEKMLTAVRNQSAVPADLRELMILRVAVLNRAGYEFEAHVPHAERAGVSAEKIEATKTLALSSVFTSTEQLLLELTDAMTVKIEVPESLMNRVRAQFDAKLTVEIVATIAAYNMVSRLLVALNFAH
jgi:4-carboxymuconolactone decarboxylase